MYNDSTFPLLWQQIFPVNGHNAAFKYILSIPVLYLDKENCIISHFTQLQFVPGRLREDRPQEESNKGPAETRSWQKSPLVTKTH